MRSGHVGIECQWGVDRDARPRRGRQHGIDDRYRRGIAVWGDSDLAIGGKYTVTAQRHAVVFKGAGAEITSDGPAPLFTNASTIAALASGQIGDSGP